MAEAMVSVLRHKSVSTELRDWLAEIKNNHQSGTADYVATASWLTGRVTVFALERRSSLVGAGSYALLQPFGNPGVNVRVRLGSS